MSLTEQELKDKIAMVDSHLKHLMTESFSDKKFAILSDYKEYLEDDLKQLQQGKK